MESKQLFELFTKLRAINESFDDFYFSEVELFIDEDMVQRILEKNEITSELSLTILSEELTDMYRNYVIDNLCDLEGQVHCEIEGLDFELFPTSDGLLSENFVNGRYVSGNTYDIFENCGPLTEEEAIPKIKKWIQGVPICKDYQEEWDNYCKESVKEKIVSGWLKEDGTIEELKLKNINVISM